MQNNVKLDIAIEIMAAKVAKVVEENKDNEEAVEKILRERDEMYKGKMEVIEKIIREYGPEIKI